MKTQIYKKAIIFIMMSMLVGLVDASGVVFEVSGWVKKDDKSLRRAQVTLFEGEEKITETNTNHWGNFTLNLESGREYAIRVSAAGAIDKTIVVNTQTIESLDRDKDCFFEFIIDVFDAENSEESPFLYHYLVFDSLNDDFIYMKPNISEHLMIDSEAVIPYENIDCCEHNAIVS